MSSSKACRSARPPGPAPVYLPIRTTTSWCVGMIVVLCPPAPRMLIALSGIGYALSALTQKCEPPEAVKEDAALSDSELLAEFLLKNS